MANNGIITQYDDEGYPVNPVFTAPLAAAASAVIKGSPGRLCRAVVTAAGTATDNLTIYDNASAASGTILAVIPGGGTVGAVYAIDMPAKLGIYAAGVASGPGVTIGYS